MAHYQEGPGFFTRREVVSSDAYRALGLVSRAILTVLQTSFRGVSTNGHLGWTERQLAEAVGISNRSSLRKALIDLQMKGFVIQTGKAEQTAKAQDRGASTFELTIYPRLDPKWNGEGNMQTARARDLWMEWRPDADQTSRPDGPGWVAKDGGGWTFDARTLPIDMAQCVVILNKAKRKIKPKAKSKPAPEIDPETIPVVDMGDIPF